MMNTILVTGGAGFIGSAVIHYLLEHTEHQVINLDKLTYAGHLASLADVSNHPRYHFIQEDIVNGKAVRSILHEYQPDAIMHLAAESHVDRSIDGPSAFIETNIIGTYQLLEAARTYWQSMNESKAERFRFHHISTDEVYGDLKTSSGYFTEATPFKPSSPYSASKASSDHLVQAWHRTYGLPVVTSNCSNNYGPRQFPEKLIPLMILKALAGEPMPIYGNGQQVRDWLYVEDHARALYTVLTSGEPGETYNIGGHNEVKNIDMVYALCDILEELGIPKPQHIKHFSDLITFVKDRLGHDQRYAIDATKIATELNWQPVETVASGLKKTVRWYLDNHHWCQRVQHKNYHRERLG